MSITPPSTPYHRFWAMGSTIQIWLDGPESEARFALQQAESIFRDQESIYSRFSQTSQLTKLNQNAGSLQSISPDMANTIARALHACSVTNGYFDCTLLPALDSAGYHKSFELIDGSSQKQTLIRGGTWKEIELDTARSKIYLPPDTQIDLGGIVKGLTGQLVVDLLQQVGPCMVDAGGDIIAGDPPEGFPGWPVGVSAPWDKDRPNEPSLYGLWLANASLATSGVDYRHWVSGGVPKHHIIDPRTGEPARTDLQTVSILAKNVDMAEAWATAALVMGAVQSIALFAKHHVAASFVTDQDALHLTPEMQKHAKFEVFE